MDDFVESMELTMFVSELFLFGDDDDDENTVILQRSKKKTRNGY